MAVILSRDYGNQQWILQCMEGIQQCVQNSVQMLSGAPVQGNNLAIGAGGNYQFPARTREELQATQREAAVGGTVSPATAQQQQVAQQADAAMAAGNVDMFEVLQRQAGMQDPASQGMPQQEAPSEPGSDEWLV